MGRTWVLGEQNSVSQIHFYITYWEAEREGQRKLNPLIPSPNGYNSWAWLGLIPGTKKALQGSYVCDMNLYLTGSVSA